MRIAVYGGSFNPPHIAHAMVISWLVWSGAVDEVWLVPVYEHAFEKIHNKRLLKFSTRVQMCKLMADQIGAGVKVSTIESELNTPSYTIDTLEALQEIFPDYSFQIVVGADVVSQVHKWKEWEKIEALFSPIIVGRVGYDGHRESMVFPNVSSTDIREQLTKGNVPASLLVSSVATFLLNNLEKILDEM